MNKIVCEKEVQDTHQTRITGLLQEFRLQPPNLAQKCKTSHRHSTISPASHKVNEFLLDIIQITRQASMVLYNIATWRIRGVLKGCTPPANRVSANLEILSSTD
jgi:hypothetical protein